MSDIQNVFKSRKSKFSFDSKINIVNRVYVVKNVKVDKSCVFYVVSYILVLSLFLKYLVF